MAEKEILQIGGFWLECQLYSAHDILWYCFADISETAIFTLKQYIE